MDPTAFIGWGHTTLRILGIHPNGRDVVAYNPCMIDRYPVFALSPTAVSALIPFGLLQEPGTFTLQGRLGAPPVVLPAPVGRPIGPYTTSAIVGLRYNDYSQAVRILLETGLDTPLILRPEPTNAYDRNAVQVWFEHTLCPRPLVLGHLFRRSASELGRRITADTVAYIDRDAYMELDTEASQNRTVLVIDVYGLLPEL